MKLKSQEYESLQEALSHMHVAELKQELERLQLSTKAFNKAELIQRIMHFVATGKELPPLEIPAISQAKRGGHYPLEPNAKMLSGAYKNDLKTRMFFKKLIGNHFHFTAYGVDWLRERWLAGNPPTYAEFAQEWQAEYERNKKEKRAPKQEWALNRFVKASYKKNPRVPKQEIMGAWEKVREEMVAQARIMLRNSLRKN